MLRIIIVENSLSIKLSNGSNTESNPITNSLFLAQKIQISLYNDDPLPDAASNRAREHAGICCLVIARRNVHGVEEASDVQTVFFWGGRCLAVRESDSS